MEDINSNTSDSGGVISITLLYTSSNKYSILNIIACLECCPDDECNDCGLFDDGAMTVPVNKFGSPISIIIMIAMIAVNTIIIMN